MKALIHDDFLLENKQASKLYHEFAAPLPIIDFHCHLPPEEIAHNQRWNNLSQVWLDGDHYKWRAMRSNGIDEHFITGAANDREKFDAYAATMPYLLRNPLYHWSHLELSRYFGIDNLLLSPETADEIWDRTSEVFQRGLSVQQLMQQSRVETVCTTDDPADSLEDHQKIAQDPSATTKVLPTWRPDMCMQLEDPAAYNNYMDQLSASAACNISDYDDLVAALRNRHDFFHQMGCRLSDHGIDVFSFSQTSESEARKIFSRIRNGEPIEASDRCHFRSAMLLEFGRMDAEKGWTKQLHIGALRFNNSRMGNTLGYDSIDDRTYASALSLFLDTLDREQQLPKTILYNLNPRDNEMMATMIGNFQDGQTAGKIQLGSGWWFLDQKDGMERQIEALSQMGLLRRFVGMVTDSRSFLSYTRHEYFRRVLCNILGKDMQKGLLPNDISLIGAMVEDICYNNAKHYFGFNHQEQ